MSKNRRPARPSKSYRPNRTVARFRNFSDLSGIGLADIYSEAYMTLELILTVCSIVQGANCHTEMLQSEASMTACMMASQIEGAKWVQQNPNFYIQKATCRPAKMFADT
jgi:hypothetical protein